MKVVAVPKSSQDDTPPWTNFRKLDYSANENDSKGRTDMFVPGRLSTRYFHQRRPFSGLALFLLRSVRDFENRSLGGVLCSVYSWRVLSVATIRWAALIILVK